MRNYFIFHGSYGHPFENWIPWLAEELIARDRIVYAPQMPMGKSYQTYDNAVKLLRPFVEIGLINKGTIFIGHSLAPVFLARFLIEHKVKAAGLISVSGFNTLLDDPSFDTVNHTFFISDQTLAKIRDFARFRVAVYSKNDPYIPHKHLEHFADVIEAEKRCIKKGGHFNLKAGYNRFDELLEIIEEKDKRPVKKAA